MIIQQIMSKNIVTVKLDDKLAKIKEMFEENRFHHLLVVESDKLLGVISDRDLLKALSPYIGTMSETAADVATLNRRAHQIMTRNPIVLHPDAEVSIAIELFNTRNISCIPIVDPEFRPLGIVSWRDILKTLGGHELVNCQDRVV